MRAAFFNRFQSFGVHVSLHVADRNLHIVKRTFYVVYYIDTNYRRKSRNAAENGIMGLRLVVVNILAKCPCRHIEFCRYSPLMHGN